MNTNTVFREDELVVRRQKQNGQWINTPYPKLGGRLRVLHEQEEKVSIETEIVRLEPKWAVVRATVTSEKGTFVGTGTASAQRDTRLADSLVELAESRSIARAARFAGVGVEYCSAEEVSHLGAVDQDEQSSGKQPECVFDEGPGDGKPEAKGGNGVPNRATQAQVRALYALTKKADYGQEDLERLLIPLSVYRFEDLTRQAASQLISHLQTEVAA
jgi:hypothetical protein